jgi:hypothetical protein
MNQPKREVERYLNLKLASLGQPTSRSTEDPEFLELARPLLRNHYRKDQLLGGRLCAADTRIQAFLDEYLRDIYPAGAPRLPANTLTLDRKGIARVLSLPPSADSISSPYLQSYRVSQGVLHNPRTDRRTTQGIFHIAEGGFPIASDKIAVPKIAFARLLAAALQPPPDVLMLPFTADQEEKARLFVTLLLRPLVCPATATEPSKSMETRFFAPGSLVSNLDFVEGIFGNGGDPYLPENDAALDSAHWTGHTGCVILAPHLPGIRKKDLGLPHYDEATERQRHDSVCWREENEAYNDGNAFKITCRDHRGVMVTIIADNYYGYCKKEVKTQISYASNLYGLCEEEHAGGAIAFPSYVLGQDFLAGRTVQMKKQTFECAMNLLGDRVEVHPERYAVDRRYSNVIYIPEDAEFHVADGIVKWQHDLATRSLTLRAGYSYVLPSGYRIRMEKQLSGAAWRLVGTRADGTLCHKPCTVSGGGKSEISKSIANALLRGPVFVRDYHTDMDQVAEVLNRDFSNIHCVPGDERARRPILSPDRSLGSVIKLLTPSAEYTEEYNEWLHGLRHTIRQLVFTVKRYYRPEWGEHWREHFTVDRVNGYLGHELKYDNQELVSNYLRVGFDPDGSWRIYKLRPDFFPAYKVQVEDDITASVVLPNESLNDLGVYSCRNPSVKLVANCEELLFQRPDEAIHRGFDKQAEADIATPGTFLSNYEPLTRDQAKAMVEHVADFDQFTEPMKRLIERTATGHGPSFVVSSANPRLVNGKASKNPRYLQLRPDLVDPREAYLAEVSARLDRDVPADKPVHVPVHAVLAGRRNNPPEPGVPALAVYNPIHYQELPELFMDFVSSLTGKSPSTTGFGSEGALTKGPFNALWPVVDLNSALVSAILTGYSGFTTAAGNVGPKYRVDHDISMLVPEIWCRMRPSEREANFLVSNGYLAKVEDFVYEGRTVLASRLGYRITALFVDRFLARMFEMPGAIFTDELLKPELQGLDVFVAGIESIVESQKRVAQSYFEDGSADAACPPLKMLLRIMADGGTADDPRVRQMFTRESLLESDWYRERLWVKQHRDTALWRRHVAALESYRATNTGPDDIDSERRLEAAREKLRQVSAPAYLNELRGTIGADPFHFQMPVA